MKAKVKDPRSALDRAIRAVRIDEPSPQTIVASRARVEARLFSASEAVPEGAPIRGCDDVQSLVAVYRRGGLRAPRALLVRNHLAECANCREVYARRGALRLATTPWRRAADLNLAPRFHPRRALVTLAAAVAFCVALLVARSAFFGVPSGQRATVQAVSGALYRIDGSISERLTPGATLSEGQVVRAGASPQSVLRLADGSTVELGERAEFSIAMRGQDTTLRLNRGQIIVQAAKRKSGHLNVATRDCRVAVTGTVFSVLASLKGSRVSVIQGEVHVAQSAGNESVLHRGDQVTTSPALVRIPIEQEVAWSRNLDEHLALLHEMTELRKQWDTVRPPELRYESRLVTLVPDDTIVYAALPNYGETLNEGYRLLKERLAESQVLKKWWESSQFGKEGDKFDGLVGKMHDLAAFLGDEVVIAVTEGRDGALPVVLAAVTKPGLRELVGSELPFLAGGKLPLVVVDEQGAASGALPAAGFEGAVLLVTPRIAALSPAPEAIAALASRLGSGADGTFAATPLGERVTEAYQNGVSLLVAADLEMLAVSSVEAQRNSQTEPDLRYLMFERKSVSGQTLNTGVLAFAGPRRGVGSWLAAPAPMGSLDFLTPQASAAAAFVVKRPAEVLDDILHLVPNADQALAKLAELEKDWNVRIREDLALTLGAEVAVALDGPILPQPAWKLVIEVEDAERLERGLETFVRRADQELQRRGEGALVFEHEQVGSHIYHRIKTRDAKIPVEADYAFVDGYLVMTPSRALLSRALEAHSSRESLARSSRFTSLLPRDGNDCLSGLVFQDLMGVVAAALGSAEVVLTPEQKQTLQKLQSESKPSLVGFYGRADRIEMAGIGDLFPLGPEALALPGLIRHTFPGTFSAPWK